MPSSGVHGCILSLLIHASPITLDSRCHIHPAIPPTLEPVGPALRELKRPLTYRTLKCFTSPFRLATITASFSHSPAELNPRLLAIERHGATEWVLTRSLGQCMCS